ncbi:hypothetical protein LINPERHAP2_LOCUS32597 [Linum perenne]
MSINRSKQVPKELQAKVAKLSATKYKEGKFCRRGS